jgi:hypothetical protein
MRVLWLPALVLLVGIGLSATRPDAPTPRQPGCPAAAVGDRAPTALLNRLRGGGRASDLQGAGGKSKGPAGPPRQSRRVPRQEAPAHPSPREVVRRADGGRVAARREVGTRFSLSWSAEEDEMLALPGVPCRPPSACESLLGPADDDLIPMPRAPTQRPEAAARPVVDSNQLVGVERLKHGLAGFSAGPSPELIDALRQQGQPGRWNSSDSPEQARPWRPYSELWLPGHETFKYFKDGHYTGEKMDRKTKDYWARIVNIYAPMLVGVPHIFLDDDAEREGTLDYSLIKDRPETTLDPLLKSTYWYTPETGYVSLWRDGLRPEENVPIDADGNLLCDPWRMSAANFSDLIDGAERGYGVAAPAESPAVIKRRRQALAPATVAVEELRGRYKGMLRDAANVAPPRMQPNMLLLMILESQWLAHQEKDVTSEAILAWLLEKNVELSLWPQHAWSALGVPFEHVAKARLSGFFLACTNRFRLNPKP